MAVMSIISLGIIKLVVASIEVIYVIWVLHEVPS